jgi:hypothetical protein
MITSKQNIATCWVRNRELYNEYNLHHMEMGRTRHNIQHHIHVVSTSILKHEMLLIRSKIDVFGAVN